MDGEELKIIQSQLDELRQDLKDDLKEIRSDLKRLFDPQTGVYPLIDNCKKRLDTLEPEVKGLRNGERKRVARISTYTTISILFIKEFGSRLWGYLF